LTILPVIIGAPLAIGDTRARLKEVSGPGFYLCCKLVVGCKTPFLKPMIFTAAKTL
jgi:hypothetical protein